MITNPRLEQLIQHCEEWAKTHKARGDDYEYAIDRDIAELLRIIQDQRLDAEIEYWSGI